MKKEDLLSVYLWILAIASLMALTMRLFVSLPVSSKSLASDSTESSFPDTCCVATLVNSQNVPDAVTLGYSLHHTGLVIPHSFAIAVEPLSNQQLQALANYFIVINGTTGEMFPELLFWKKLKQCRPVVAVSATGVFHKPVDELCRAEPFASVSGSGDTMYFNPELMVLDPRDEPNGPPGKTWKSFVNRAYLNWKQLPPHFAVRDYKNDYLDFTFRYREPIYVYFNKNTFRRAVAGSDKTDDSKFLYKILKGMVAAAKEEHREVYDSLSLA